MPIDIRPAVQSDAAALHRVAAVAFPYATSPGAPRASIDAYIAEHLSEQRFARYLADPVRRLLLAEIHGEPVGYAMLVLGDPTDLAVARAVSARPTVELSKFYVLPEHHGLGIAAALMEATIREARTGGAAGLWLNVNQQNTRAARFYDKHGFVVVGTKQFQLADRVEDDFIRELVLAH